VQQNVTPTAKHSLRRSLHHTKTDFSPQYVKSYYYINVIRHMKTSIWHYDLEF